MNTLVALMGLLVLSYVGSLLVDRRRARTLGLPSGVEFVALGVLVGPGMLALVDGELLVPLTPLAYVAVGWVTFGFGLESTFVGARRIRTSSLLLGWLFALLTAAAVAAAAFALVWRLWGWSWRDAALVSSGLGAVGCETARQAVGWVAERHEARGPLVRRLTEIAHAGALVPALVAGAQFAVVTPAGAGLGLVIPAWSWLGFSVLLGLMLGAVAAILLARELRLDESWGVLIGTVLFALGIAVRLGLSSPCVAFFLGLGMAGLSRHRHEIVTMVAPTERAVALPALLLVGLRLDLGAAGTLLLLAAAVLAARLLAQLACGLLLWTSAREARPAGVLNAPALSPAGKLSLVIALAFELRFPGPVGDAVLLAAAVIALAGELLGPAAIKSALGRAGESAESIIALDGRSPT